ncbi:ATP-binding cassette domain-containing protein [Corynebacterium bovis]|uniref:ATP-binding cassette domain-containing protein n=2 Tax=Corynebacterium bovis TaxID=36808 RepID=UPI003D748378
MCTPATMGESGVMITVDNLTKKYGRTNAVEGLSFTVPDATVTGFLGPNGSGKSTTMRCILGLDRPTAGGATVDGVPFSSIEAKPAAVGALLDATWFTPGRSGRSHLRVIARGAGISDARVDECLEIVGLTSAAGKRAGGYSLGMKQRLGLAAALLGDPRHLILDEPVNGLDPEGVSWMRSMIRHLAGEGRAVLVSSHLLSEMQLTADRLVVIGRGRLIGEYTMDEFLSGGARVVVETADTDRLATALRGSGAELTVRADRQPPELVVAVPEGGDEAEVRAMVAHTALREGVAVTALRTENENLEQRFLAATAGAQEYRTANHTGAAPSAQLTDDTRKAV